MEASLKTWTMRILGLLNILFAVFALFFEAAALWLSRARFPTKVTPTPMDWVIFALLLAVSNYLVVHPALYGVKLIRKTESAILPCALLFAAQTLVFVIGVYTLLYWRSMLDIVTGLWLFALLPIEFSVGYGYSTLGLVVTITLLILSRRTTSNAAKDATTIAS
jgi:hypothetical protein